MFHSLRNGYTRVVLGAILVMAFGSITAYQYPANSSVTQMAIDICDHTDAEKECEEISKGDYDEFVEQGQKTIVLTNIRINDKAWWTHKDYPMNHQENPTPPPEHSI